MSDFLNVIMDIGAMVIGLIVFAYVIFCVAIITSMWFPPVSTHLQICTFYPNGSTCIGGPGS